MFTLSDMAYESSFGRTSQLPASTCPEFVFTGRSNVGKSSMINKVFNRKSLARTSQVPGKTATINFYRSGAVRFVDLPGYGYAKTGKEEQKRLQSLIRGYLGADRDFSLVFLLMDMRHPPAQADMDMANFLIDREMPMVAVLTKADKLSPAEQSRSLALFAERLPCGGDMTILPFSSQTGQGADAVRDIIRECWPADDR